MYIHTYICIYTYSPETTNLKTFSTSDRANSGVLCPRTLAVAGGLSCSGLRWYFPFLSAFFSWKALNAYRYIRSLNLQSPILTLIIDKSTFEVICQSMR